MGFTNGAYAKIKEVEDKGNYTKAKISISKRVKNSNPAQFICTYAGWVSMVGKAHQCRPLSGQKIKITNCDVTNGYLDRDGQQKFSQSAQATIFEYELQQEGAQGNSYVPPSYNSASSVGFEPMETDDSLPF